MILDYLHLFKQFQSNVNSSLTAAEAVSALCIRLEAELQYWQLPQVSGAQTSSRVPETQQPTVHLILREGQRQCQDWGLWSGSPGRSRTYSRGGRDYFQSISLGKCVMVSIGRSCLPGTFLLGQRHQYLRQSSQALH